MFSMRLNCKSVIKICIAMLMPVFLISCATIVRSKHQTVAFETNVDDVDITVRDKRGTMVFKGKAPIVLPLSAAKPGYFNAENYTIQASKQGFQPQTLQLPAKVSGWYVLGNFFFGGLVGWIIVDPISGDMFYLDDSVKINMQPN